MAHTHSAQDDTYYLDQLCLVGISAAFGGICLALYFWQTEMLNLLLDVQFHPYILLTGIVLLMLVAVRSVVLWRTVALAGAPSHTHDHDHDHDHDHAHHDHAHDHDHHHHDHAVGQAHTHDDGHDHGWAPWRYVVLLIPIMLYLLGLPSKRPDVEGSEVDTTREATREALQSAHMVALASRTILPGLAPLQEIAAVAALTANPSVEAPVFVDDQRATLDDLKPGMPVQFALLADGRLEEIRAGKTAVPADPKHFTGVVKDIDASAKMLTVTRKDGSSEREETYDLAQGPVTGVDFKTLHAIAFNPDMQRKWAGKTVQVVGQFAPRPHSDRVFSLARYRIQCCGADAIELNIPIICRESVRDFQRNQWVRVTGRVEFREVPGRAGKATYLLVARKGNIKVTGPEPDPYIR